MVIYDNTTMRKSPASRAAPVRSFFLSLGPFFFLSPGFFFFYFQFYSLRKAAIVGGDG